MQTSRWQLPVVRGGEGEEKQRCHKPADSGLSRVKKKYYETQQDTWKYKAVKYNKRSIFNIHLIKSLQY